MKITPAEFVQNITQYTEDERKSIVLSMSPEDLVQLQFHLTAARETIASASNNADVNVERIKASRSEAKQTKDIIFDKEKAARGSDEAFSECARVFRAQNDSLGSWHSILDKLKTFEDRETRAGITRVSDKAITAFISLTEGNSPECIVYNKLANRVYDVSKLWVVLYQNLQNVKMDLTWDSMAAGTEALRSFETGILTAPINHKIDKINRLFQGLNYAIERRLRFDWATLNELMVTKARFADDQLLINMILRKIVICMKYSWNNTFESTPGIHQEHWYEPTYKNLINTTFIDTCNSIIDDLKPEIVMLRDEISVYREKGYRELISAHPSCTLGMGVDDIYHIVPASINKFLKNPETIPKDLSMNELHFYDTCADLDFNEISIVRRFNK